MSTTGEGQRLLDVQANLVDTLTEMLSGSLATRPELADSLIDAVNERFDAVIEANEKLPGAADSGLAALVGVGDETVPSLGQTDIVERVQPYDEQVASERISAIADMYYIMNIEKAGVIKAVQKLKQLFDAGSVRLSTGEGAFGLYRFDRRQVLRYTRSDRQAVYRRAFGYGTGALAPGAHANTDFHHLFVAFNKQVAKYWRDKRISDVIRERAHDPSFGAMAEVKRAAHDARNNLKFTSYGNIAVMRVEVMQLLGDAFKILEAPDVMALFGAEGPWDVVEEILTRYYNVVPMTSPIQSMGVTGRNILRWLAQPYILEQSRPQFEAKLKMVADDAEEWLTSASTIRSSAQERRVVSPGGAKKTLPGRPSKTPRLTV